MIPVAKMRNIICCVVFTLFSTVSPSAAADTVPSAFSRQPQWHIGSEISPAYVPATNAFMRGENPVGKRIEGSFSGDLRAGFSFNPETREGMLFKGLYQGIGTGTRTFFSNSLLGTPTTLYVYQGSPIKHFNGRLWLGYEWQFGAAFGWKHYRKHENEYNLSVSTPVTAFMGVGLKLHYSLSDRVALSFGIAANHFSNGNTSWPNGGVNSAGASLGVAYIFNPQKISGPVNTDLEEEADRHRWFYDIMVYGAYRKRVVFVGSPVEPQVCPGKFGVLGFQFSPMYRLNRWVAVGPSIDPQWDESAGLAPFWVEGSSDESIKFYRPPFGKQISVGLSAHAELTMPIFTVNGGVGLDIINPKGDKRFYQSLTLKTFITSQLYLNVGYSLRDFKDPRNLMLGLGVRIK